ncbi:MAG: hypothetical protein ABI334_09575 [Candidatus Dormiibacterota bacterium]
MADSLGMSIEDVYQEIGHQARDIAGDDLGGRLLVYAEVEHGVVSADLAYKTRNGDVNLEVGPGPLVDLVYELWKRWKAQPGNKEWRLMSYVVDDDGKLTIDLTYPEDVDKDEDEMVRRQRTIENYFGKVKLSYTNPF